MKAGKKSVNKYKNLKSDNGIKEIIFWIVLVIIGVFSIVCDTPKFTTGTGRIILLVIINLLITGLIIYFSFFCDKKNRVKGFLLILAVATIIFIWLRHFISLKAELTISAVLTVITVSCAVYRYLRFEQKNKVLFGISIYYVLFNLMQAMNFSIIDNDSVILDIAIVLFAIICTLVSILLIIKNKYLKDIGLANKIFLPFLVLLFSASISFSLIVNLNYSLDKSEPIVKSGTIVEQQLDSGYRRITSFKFIIDIDGEEIYIEVPGDEYYSYKVGDTYEASFYKGFFDIPFYTAY